MHRVPGGRRGGLSQGEDGKDTEGTSSKGKRRRNQEGARPELPLGETALWSSHPPGLRGREANSLGRRKKEKS